MGVSNFDIDNQIKRNLHYFKHQKDIIDAKNTRASMISLRNKWAQSQKNITKWIATLLWIAILVLPYCNTSSTFPPL